MNAGIKHSSHAFRTDSYVILSGPPTGDTCSSCTCPLPEKLRWQLELLSKFGRRRGQAPGREKVWSLCEQMRGLPGGLLGPCPDSDWALQSSTGMRLLKRGRTLRSGTCPPPALPKLASHPHPASHRIGNLIQSRHDLDILICSVACFMVS